MPNEAVFNWRRFLRFICVGGAATLCQYLVLALFVELLDTKAAVASSIGYGAGAAVSYVMNRLWTFKTDLSHTQNLPRFFVMIGIGFLLSFVVMRALADVAGMNYLLAQALTTGIVMVSNYLLAASWVFIVSGEREEHEHI
jgi:putative flippase GtrA